MCPLHRFEPIPGFFHGYPKRPFGIDVVTASQLDDRQQSSGYRFFAQVI